MFSSPFTEKKKHSFALQNFKKQTLKEYVDMEEHVLFFKISTADTGTDTGGCKNQERLVVESRPFTVILAV